MNSICFSSCRFKRRSKFPYYINKIIFQSRQTNVELHRSPTGREHHMWTTDTGQQYAGTAEFHCTMEYKYTYIDFTKHYTDYYRNKEGQSEGFLAGVTHNRHKYIMSNLIICTVPICTILNTRKNLEDKI